MKKQEHLTVVGYLKESYYALVDENKKLKRKLDEESKLWSELKKENKELKKENKEYKDTMNQMIKEAWKLKQLVDKLREAIEEEKNWFVKAAVQKMFDGICTSKNNAETVEQPAKN